MRPLARRLVRAAARSRRRGSRRRHGRQNRKSDGARTVAGAPPHLGMRVPAQGSGRISMIDSERRATAGSLGQLDRYWRAANYLGAAQLYLKENVLLRDPLRVEHLKPRPVGHWGTQPGINLIYAHLNRLIRDTDADVLLVVGPGHGAPAVLANMYLDGSLASRYPELDFTNDGIARFVRRFSWPGGFPSHVGPTTPGTIHEGGELGHSLAHAFGAAFDNPDLIVACIVGDGESETGPLAAVPALAALWHGRAVLRARERPDAPVGVLAAGRDEVAAQDPRPGAAD